MIMKMKELVPPSSEGIGRYRQGIELVARQAGRQILSVMQGAVDYGHKAVGNPSYRDLGHAVSRDELTRTYNRRGLIEALDAFCNETGEDTFLGAFIDVIGLGEVNNGYTHEIGDKLLTVAGWGIKRKFRLPKNAQALVGRIGGDEFVALLPQNVSTNEQMQMRYDDSNGACTATIDIDMYRDDESVPEPVKRAMHVLLQNGVSEVAYRYNIGEIKVADCSSASSLVEFLARCGSKYTRESQSSADPLDSHEIFATDSLA